MYYLNRKKFIFCVIAIEKNTAYHNYKKKQYTWPLLKGVYVFLMQQSIDR